jgi:nitrogen fixation protein NifB
MTPNPPHNRNLNLTLPIAPNANHRKVGEEGTLANAMLPTEAINWIAALKQGGQTIQAINLTGPGDPLTSWDATVATLELLEDESAPISLTCLGLSGFEHGPELLQYKIKHITVLVDTINPETAMSIYQWIRPGKKNIPLVQSADVLISEQEKALKFWAAADLDVVVRTEVIPGVNDGEIVAIAKKMAGLGVKRMEVIGGESVVKEVEKLLEVQLVKPEPPMPPPGSPTNCTGLPLPAATQSRPYLAVASSDGMDVNLHLGQAEKLLIYGPREDGLACLLETRDTPMDGNASRWQDLAETLPDCFAILASHAGAVPREQLASAGINVVLVEDQIEGLVDQLFGGGKKKCKS